jgi:hypothetical protein
MINPANEPLIAIITDEIVNKGLKTMKLYHAVVAFLCLVRRLSPVLI